MNSADPRNTSATSSTPEQKTRAEAELRLQQLLAPFASNTPGLAVLMNINGETVFERYLGAADIAHGVTVAAETGFHIASASKQFTAFAVLLEVQAGRLDLEADVRDYLPEFPDFGARIAVLDLIHHTAGLRDVADLLSLSGQDLGGVIRQSSTVALVLRQRALNFPPRSRHHYSNSGYTLLAEIVARTSGQKFPRYVEAQIFAPLGMHASLVYDNDGRLLANEAKSYRLNARGEVRLARMNNSCFGPRGAFTTARDLAKWGRELLHPTVFAPELMTRMTSPGRLPDGRPVPYGYGLASWWLGGRRALSHYGGDQGYAAAFHCFPEDGAVMVVLSNGQADIGAIEQALAEAFLGGTASARAEPDAATLEALEGYYVWSGGPGLLLEARDGKLVSRQGEAHTVATFTTGGGFYLAAATDPLSLEPSGDLTSGGTWSSTLGYRRTQRVRPSGDDLARLIGTYRSDELDSTYELTSDGRSLRLSCLRLPPLDLSPADEDAFESSELRLHIVRDAAGAPTGFHISTWGSWNLWFRKIE